MSNQGKSVAFKKAPVAADDWVKERAQPGQAAVVTTVASAQPESPKIAAPRVVAPPEPKVEEMKRFTIDVTETLHKRIKAECAMRGVHMADVIRDMLEKEFAKS